MNSVQHQLQAFRQGAVTGDQQGSFHGMIAMLDANLLKDRYLVRHEPQVILRRASRPAHVFPSAYNLAGQGNPSVGFFGCHGEYRGMNFWKRHALSMVVWGAVALVVLWVSGRGIW